MQEERLVQLLAEVQALPATPTGPHLSDEEYVAYILEELPPGEAARIDVHLGTCPECTQALGAFFAAAEAFPEATWEQQHSDFVQQLRADLQQAGLPPEVPKASEGREAAQPGRLAQVAAGLVSGLSALWESLAWHPPFAGEPVTAGQTAPRTERFPSPYGEIQATCAWHAASATHPATLRLTWQARLSRPGDIWVRFVSRDDPAVQLSEAFCLGSGVTGSMEWSAATLGFDPTLVPWSLVLCLTEPQR